MYYFFCYDILYVDLSSCRYGFLRNLFARWCVDPTDMYVGPKDKQWTHVRRERQHFYFLVEFLLQDSDYAVFDLRMPVENFADCHHHSISYQLMGFMYFLLYEFIFHQRVYTKSMGRDALKSRMAIINYFVDIAEKEWDDFIAPTDPKINKEIFVAFYK